ncbi:MAG: DUF520 family protein, partial [Bacteroidetes bacterium]|nr:DUF520 family protein [Bacteroidota bacterium]
MDKNRDNGQGADDRLAQEREEKKKDSGIKVQASIMDDIVRVTGKKLDDLQSVIALCRAEDFGLPLQFVNMKS